MLVVRNGPDEPARRVVPARRGRRHPHAHRLVRGLRGPAAALRRRSSRSSRPSSRWCPATGSGCASSRSTSAGRSGSTTRTSSSSTTSATPRCPPPGSEDDLRRLMGRLMSQELDRHRPLWEAWMVEGLEGGALGDDHQGPPLHGRRRRRRRPDRCCSTTSRTPAPAGPDVWDPEPEPSTLRLVGDAALAAGDEPGRAGPGRRPCRSAPRQALGALAETSPPGSAPTAAALRPTPRTSLDGAIGPHRRWVVARATLDDVRAIRQALGGTVNDVVLAAIAGGFRDLLAGPGRGARGRRAPLARARLGADRATHAATSTTRCRPCSSSCRSASTTPSSGSHAVRQQMGALKAVAPGRGG